MTELKRNPELSLPEGVTETDQQYVTRLEDLVILYEEITRSAYHYAEEAFK